MLREVTYHRFEYLKCEDLFYHIFAFYSRMLWWMSKETFLVRDFVKSYVRWNLCCTIDLCWSIISWQELLLRDYRNKVEEEEKDVEKVADEDDVAAVRSTLIMRTWRILTLRFQIFLFLFLIIYFFAIKRCKYIHYSILQEQKKRGTPIDINGER